MRRETRGTSLACPTGRREMTGLLTAGTGAMLNPFSTGHHLPSWSWATRPGLPQRGHGTTEAACPQAEKLTSPSWPQAHRPQAPTMTGTASAVTGDGSRAGWLEATCGRGRGAGPAGWLARCWGVVTPDAPLVACFQARQVWQRQPLLT
jgi:hypothetical protein